MFATLNPFFTTNTKNKRHIKRLYVAKILVETEAMNLHEGNIARYHIRPSQYQTWRETWLWRPNL